MEQQPPTAVKPIAGDYTNPMPGYTMDQRLKMIHQINELQI